MAITLHGGSGSDGDLAMVIFKPKNGLGKYYIFTNVEPMVISDHLNFTILNGAAGLKNKLVVASCNPDFASL